MSRNHCYKWVNPDMLTQTHLFIFHYSSCKAVFNGGFIFSEVMLDENEEKVDDITQQNLELSDIEGNVNWRNTEVNVQTAMDKVAEEFIQPRQAVSFSSDLCKIIGSSSKKKTEKETRLI